MRTMTMRYSCRTRLPSAEVLGQAKVRFDGLGLRTTDETTSRLVLESDKGFIAVQVRGGEGREVDVITEGFEKQVKEFLKRLG
jgi:hypothetical protein